MDSKAVMADTLRRARQMMLEASMLCTTALQSSNTKSCKAPLPKLSAIALPKSIDCLISPFATVSALDQLVAVYDTDLLDTRKQYCSQQQLPTMLSLLVDPLSETDLQFWRAALQPLPVAPMLQWTPQEASDIKR